MRRLFILAVAALGLVFAGPANTSPSAAAATMKSLRIVPFPLLCRLLRSSPWDLWRQLKVRKGSVRCYDIRVEQTGKGANA